MAIAKLFGFCLPISISSYSAQMAGIYYIGVDVGTSSVRAALISVTDGALKVHEVAVLPINIWNDTPDHFEQSSNEIWKGVVSTVRDILSCSGVSKDNVKGIGFDATCSLVVLDKSKESLSVSISKNKDTGHKRFGSLAHEFNV